MVREILNGKDLEPGTTKTTVVIAGDSIRYYFDAELKTEWAVMLDVTKQPKEIDEKQVFGAKEGQLGPIVLHGIYRLDRDSLQIAFISGGPGRPSDFEEKGRGEANCWSSVLKRVKR